LFDDNKNHVYAREYLACGLRLGNGMTTEIYNALVAKGHIVFSISPRFWYSQNPKSVLGCGYQAWKGEKYQGLRKEAMALPWRRHISKGFSISKKTRRGRKKIDE